MQQWHYYYNVMSISVPELSVNSFKILTYDRPYVSIGIEGEDLRKPRIGFIQQGNSLRVLNKTQRSSFWYSFKRISTWTINNNTWSFSWGFNFPKEDLSIVIYVPEWMQLNIGNISANSVAFIGNFGQSVFSTDINGTYILDTFTNLKVTLDGLTNLDVKNIYGSCELILSNLAKVNIHSGNINPLYLTVSGCSQLVCNAYVADAYISAEQVGNITLYNCQRISSLRNGGIGDVLINNWRYNKTT